MAQIYKFQGGILKPAMDDITARKRFKQAKVYKEHIEAIMKVTHTTISVLSKFEIYGPVHSMLSNMRLETKLLTTYLEECNKIISSKGKV